LRSLKRYPKHLWMLPSFKPTKEFWRISFLVTKEATSSRWLGSVAHLLLPRPPFCATTTYLAYPLPLAKARSLGAYAPRELLFAPSGIVTHSVWEELL
jgi:hypothetical protein